MVITPQVQFEWGARARAFLNDHPGMFSHDEGPTPVPISEGETGSCYILFDYEFSIHCPETIHEKLLFDIAVCFNNIRLTTNETGTPELVWWTRFVLYVSLCRLLGVQVPSLVWGLYTAFLHDQDVYPAGQAQLVLA